MTTSQDFFLLIAANGISLDPCSDLFCGASVWSEPSVNAIRTYLEANQGNMVAFVSVHSYTQLWLTPYSYQEGEYPPNNGEIVSI